MATDPLIQPANLDPLIIDPDRAFDENKYTIDPLAQLPGESLKNHSLLCDAATLPVWERGGIPLAARYGFSRQWMSRIRMDWNWENRLHENDLLIARRARSRSAIEVNAVAANLTHAASRLTDLIVDALDNHITAESLSPGQLAPLLSVMLKVAEHQMPGAEERELDSLEKELAHLDVPRANATADLLRNLAADPELLDKVITASAPAEP
jgi:hypothetical protein